MRSDFSERLVNSLSVFTSSTQIYQIGYGAVPLAPAATVNNTTALNNFGSWQTISFCYTPTVSTDDFLIIGTDNAVQSPVTSTASPVGTCTQQIAVTAFNRIAYLYIDNVSCMEMSTFLTGATYSICPNAPTVITATNSCTSYGGAGSTYSWAPVTGLTPNAAAQSPTTSINSQIIYTVNFSVPTLDGQSCVATNTVFVGMKASAGNLSITPSPTFVCPGSSNTLTASGGVSITTYTWNPPTAGITGTSIVISPTTNVTYTVSATNSVSGCSSSATIQLTNPWTTLAANASPQIICTNLGQSTTAITATGLAGTTYTWNPGALTGSAQVVTPTVSTVYTLSALFGGCTQTRTLSVVVNSACCTQTMTAFDGVTFPITNPGSNLTYSSPLIFNADVTIAPTMSVDFQNAEFLFAPNVKIIVSGGAQLTLEGAHLYACNTMWQGIQAANGSNVTTIQGSNTNLIEDALKAIDVVSVTTTTLSILKTTFNKNLIGINIDNYFTGTQPAPISIKECVFTSRTLTFSPSSWPSTSTSDLRSATNATTGLAVPYLLQSASVSSLIAPYTSSVSQSGIKLTGVGVYTLGYGAVIGSTTNVTDFNLFDNLVYGIDALNTNVKVTNNVFQNTHSTFACNPKCGVQPGVGIKHYVTTTENLYLNMNSGSTNVSLGNRFWNCGRGVDLSNTYQFDCNYATFRSTQSNTANTTYNGIYARTNRFNYDISSNTFNNINTCIQVPIMSGSYISGGSTLTGIYANNLYIQSNYFGAQLTGTTITDQYLNYAALITAPNSFTWNNVANTGLYIAANTIDRAYRGVYVSGLRNYPSTTVNNSVTLVDDGYYAGNQSGISFANCLQTQVIQTNTLSGANTTNTLMTLVYSGANANPYVTCNDLSSSYQGFEFNSINPGASWKGNKMQPLARGMVLANNGRIFQQGGTGNPIDNQWNGTWTVNVNYGTWTADNQTFSTFSPLYTRSVSPYSPPNDWGTPSTQSYTQTGLNTTTGAYSCTLCNDCNPNVARPDMSGYNDNDAYIANNTLYRYLYFNPSLLSGDLSTFFSDLSGSSMDKFMQAEEKLNDRNTADASTLVSGVTATNTIEDNYKTYYNLYINYLTNDSLSSSDSTDLIGLAQLCPGIDGSCVYQARALYDLINKTSISYAEVCSGGHSRPANPNNTAPNNSGSSPETSSIEMDRQMQFGLYPNPAKNEVIISSKDRDGKMVIKVNDTNGRLLIDEQIDLSNNTGKLKFDLQNGIYFVTLINAKNERLVKKLVIAK